MDIACGEYPERDNYKNEGMLTELILLVVGRYYSSYIGTKYIR